MFVTVHDAVVCTHHMHRGQASATASMAREVTLPATGRPCWQQPARLWVMCSTRSTIATGEPCVLPQGNAGTLRIVLCCRDKSKDHVRARTASQTTPPTTGVHHPHQHQPSPVPHHRSLTKNPGSSNTDNSGVTKAVLLNNNPQATQGDTKTRPQNRWVERRGCRLGPASTFPRPKCWWC